MAIFHPIKGEHVFVWIDHEGGSSSICAHGLLINIVWKLDKHFSQQFQRMYELLGCSRATRARDDACRMIWKLCMINRSDVIVCEDGPIFFGMGKKDLIEQWWLKKPMTNPLTGADDLPKWEFNKDKVEDAEGYHRKLACGNVYVMPTSGKHGGDIATLLNFCCEGDHTAWVTVLMWPESATENQPKRAEYKNLLKRSGYYKYLQKRGQAQENTCTSYSVISIMLAASLLIHCTRHAIPQILKVSGMPECAMAKSIDAVHYQPRMLDLAMTRLLNTTTQSVCKSLIGFCPIDALWSPYGLSLIHI